MRELSPAVIPTINQLEHSVPFVWLLEMRPNDTEAFYLCNDNEAVEFDGQTYLPFPFQIGTLEEDGSGNLRGLQVRVSNITQQIGGLVEKNLGFTGRRVVLTLVHRSHTESPNRRLLRQDFRVQEAIVREADVTFTIGNEDLIKFQVPAGRFLRGRCRFAYKGSSCGYSGGIDACDKKLRSSNGCEAHVNQLRFGGFPGIPRT